jgi:hypothetical protein
MKMNAKNIFLWIFSLFFTLGIAYYQRTTGPTYEKRGKVLLDGTTIKYELIRSAESTGDAAVKIKVPDEEIMGAIKYRRYKTNEDWVSFPMMRVGDELVGILPVQPPAGKLEYQVALNKGERFALLEEEPVVIRFTGAVPLAALVPHVIIMFFAMMMSTRTLLEALLRKKNTYVFAWITVVSLFIGGLILGPVVQKYAFGEFWTGWPLGQDLTDNKTLFAWVIWLVALIRLRKNPKNVTWPVIAGIILLLVYLIPHSMFGSELDYSSGEINTGK